MDSAAVGSSIGSEEDGSGFILGVLDLQCMSSSDLSSPTTMAAGLEGDNGAPNLVLRIAQPLMGHWCSKLLVNCDMLVIKMKTCCCCRLVGRRCLGWVRVSDHLLPWLQIGCATADQRYVSIGEDVKSGFSGGRGSARWSGSKGELLDFEGMLPKISDLERIADGGSRDARFKGCHQCRKEMLRFASSIVAMAARSEEEALPETSS
ncbi:hypothetical protein ACLOJK_027154 [Asimina triloba]